MGSGGYGMSTMIFAGTLVLALLAGLLLGVGGGLAIIAVAMLATIIFFARSEQAMAPSQTSAIFAGINQSKPANEPTSNSSASGESEAHPS